MQESVSLASDIGGKGLEPDAVEWTAMTDPPATRARFPHFLAVPTRWMDNDAYGHVNNVVYYSYFDTVINRYLVEEGGLDIANGAVIGLCVESHCRYAKPVAFPDDLDAGLRVEHLGRSSVRYGIGIFARGTPPEGAACAEGWFVHVFVDRATRTSTPLPDRLRAALEKLRA
ncbi:MAG TPA: thioesterase family protein [Polyangiaceae bacterium]